MLNWLSKLFLEKWSGSVVRHLLSTAAGFLLSIGIAPDAVRQFEGSGNVVLIGLLTWGVAQLLSLAEKGKR